MRTDLLTREETARLMAAALVSLFGVLFLVPTTDRLLGGSGGAAESVLAGLGAALAAVLVSSGYLLFRSDFTPRHCMRVAGWATLGTVLLGLVLAVIVRSGVDLPLFAAVTLLSVSTFAHVLIGVRDVQRIRAEALAREREKLAVLDRLVRHNLKHEAQYLIGIASRIPADATAESDLSARVRSVADDLTRINDVLTESRGLLEAERRPVDLTEMIEGIAAEYRDRHPGATIDVDVPEGCHVRAGGELRSALEELVENGIQHAESSPHIEMSGREGRTHVTLTVTDSGPGLPEIERSVIMREADIDQLTHSQGLGLWFVRWVMDAYDGGMDIEADSNGTTVTLELPSARGN